MTTKRRTGCLCPCHGGLRVWRCADPCRHEAPIADEANQLDALFQMQWDREMAVIRQWRQEGHIAPLVLPDHGRFFRDLLDRTLQDGTRLQAIRDVLDAYSWMLEGRGPYEFDDPAFDLEVRKMMVEIRDAMGLPTPYLPAPAAPPV